MEPLNLSDVATDCVLAFEPVAFEAGKPLEERITADVTVVGDADRLRRLISILLDNAVKYGAEGGHITLTLEKTDRQARLTVSNPGDPIPPEHLAHLFERFYRADASRGEKSGFGLGLAIADTIAWEHKGALKAESDAASTRFIFTMPLKTSVKRMKKRNGEALRSAFVSCFGFYAFFTLRAMISGSTQKKVNSPVASSFSSSPRMSTATRQVEWPRCLTRASA